MSLKWLNNNEVTFFIFFFVHFSLTLSCYCQELIVPCFRQYTVSALCVKELPHIFFFSCACSRICVRVSKLFYSCWCSKHQQLLWVFLFWKQCGRFFPSWLASDGVPSINICIWSQQTLQLGLNVDHWSLPFWGKWFFFQGVVMSPKDVTTSTNVFVPPTSSFCLAPILSKNTQS